MRDTRRLSTTPNQNTESMTSIPHPFDPLSPREIELAVEVVKKAHGNVKFNVVAAQEPRKAEMTAWLASPSTARRPKRVADVVIISSAGKIYQGLVDLEARQITKWAQVDGAQPIVGPKNRCLQFIS